MVGSFNRKLYRKVMHICSCRPICAYDLVLFIFVPNFYSVYVSSRLFFPITFSAVFSEHGIYDYCVKVYEYHKPVVPKVCSVDPKGSATSSQGLSGCLSIMATLNLVFCYK